MPCKSMCLWILRIKFNPLNFSFLIKSIKIIFVTVALSLKYFNGTAKYGNLWMRLRREDANRKE
jgi:hypothetical protein